MAETLWRGPISVTELWGFRLEGKVLEWRSPSVGRYCPLQASMSLASTQASQPRPGLEVGVWGEGVGGGL